MNGPSCTRTMCCCATEPFTLCEGRTATLELYGYQNGEYDCGVSRIHLLWDDGREENLLHLRPR